MRVDAIYENGRIWTGDADRPEVTELGVLHGRLVCVGDVSELVSDVRIDLEGKRVIPGLHDAHHHLGLTGRRLLNVNVRPTAISSLAELYERIAERAAETPADGWVFASGYDQNFLGGEHPTAEGLDRVAGGRPVLLEHVSGHMIVANTAAFERAGYPGRENYPEIPGGRVFRDADGLPEGLLQETAMDPVRSAGAAASRDPEVVAEALRLASEQAVRYGLTSITEPGVAIDGAIGAGTIEMDHYLRAVANDTILPRMTVMPFHTALHSIPEAPEGMKSFDWGIRTGLGDDRLRIGPVKIVSDGSLIGRSAAVHECYCGEPDNYGVLQVTPEELHDAILAYHRAGWTVATHAIGDRAIDNVLDAVAEAQAAVPREVRHRIEHFAIATDEQVARGAELGLIPVPQGVFISDFDDGILEAIGEERSAGTYRMRSFLDAGMVVPGSTDSPVSDANPFVSIHDLVNRVTSGGKPFGQHECVTVEEAVVAYTYGSAYAVDADHERGRIMDGQLADFIALSDDIFAIDQTTIRDLTVETTVIGGKVVYAA
ncbi:amidohydrolase [Leucobacter sp. cx-328]|uniref:amidohydrolase n=1 Tax=unclassified Leucobacter TaxID=2621730 RepID=UPI00165D8F91|nr:MULTISPECIES: amidohydrolase [unclassified Leucobacter]MBC9943193.1 amidohydrolase [Leucobacter sp. cx-328]